MTFTSDNSFEFSALPQSISIYPSDFKAKDKMTDYLDQWNNKDLDITLIWWASFKYSKQIASISFGNVALNNIVICSSLVSDN